MRGTPDVNHVGRPPRGEDTLGHGFRPPQGGLESCPRSRATARHRVVPETAARPNCGLRRSWTLENRLQEVNDAPSAWSSLRSPRLPSRCGWSVSPSCSPSSRGNAPISRPSGHGARERDLWDKERTPAALEVVGVQGLVERAAPRLDAQASAFAARAGRGGSPDAPVRAPRSAQPPACEVHVGSARPRARRAPALDARALPLHHVLRLPRRVHSAARLPGITSPGSMRPARSGSSGSGGGWASAAWRGLPVLRRVDVEEFLEDEALEAEERELHGEAGAPGRGGPLRCPPRAGVAAAPAPGSDGEDR